MTDAAEPLSMNATPSCAEAAAVGCHIPDWLMRLEDEFGDTAAIQFIEAFGGKELAIPIEGRIHGGLLERFCGPRVTDWFCKELGFGRVEVPLGPASISAKRKVLIFRALQRGLSCPDIATLAQCSRQTVIRHRRQFEQLGYLKQKETAS